MDKPHTQSSADIVLITALLGSFRALEFFVAGATLLGVMCYAQAGQGMVMLLSAGVFASGMAALYYALRIRIDHRIFAHWNEIDTAALDASLQKMNPNFKAGRSLDSRLAGARSLFKRGIILVLLQCALLALLAWAG